MPDWVVDLLTSSASLAAVIVAIIAIRSYRQLRPEALLLRRQNELFLSLSTEVLLMSKSLLEICKTLDRDGSVRSDQCTPYSNTSRRLVGVLDKSAKLEIVHKIFGSDHNLAVRLLAVRGALAKQSSLSERTITEEAGREDLQGIYDGHLWFGLLKIARTCEERSRHPNTQNSLTNQLQEVIHDVELLASITLAAEDELPPGIGIWFPDSLLGLVDGKVAAKRP